MIANTTVSVLRGLSTTDEGDEATEDYVVAARVPFSIVEIWRKGSAETSQDQRSYVYAVGRTKTPFDYQAGDRLRDERTGAVYDVDKVSRQRGVALTPAIRLNIHQAR